ncbi:hypothetical protein WJX82_004352 [Trebouxia sp. C0006]
MLRLKCPSQNYAWGRLARSNSEVAALAAAAGSAVDHEKPYAELWMGTHPSGPSMLAADPTTSLQDWLEQHSQALGPTVLKRFGLKLPFLFKVLSVETALSIQSHPDKELAERLHAQHPEIYKDSNHKPEMALAITDFEALWQAIYLPANEPHAYVSGQLVECMATSDNVIRAGLTPKLRDTTILCESLTYNQGPPVMLQGDLVQEYTTVYSPPFDEFEVYKVSLPESADTIIPANQGPTVVLVMRGRGNVTATSALKAFALEEQTRCSKGVGVIDVDKRSVVYDSSYVACTAPVCVQALEISRSGSGTNCAHHCVTFWRFFYLTCCVWDLIDQLRCGCATMVSHIHAFVRVRPLLPREFAQSTAEAVSVYEDQRIRVSKDHTVLESDFDEVLGQEATQDQVFASAQGCVDCVLEGYNGSILAYGATGSGKTFTMLGSFNENADVDNAGLIPRALRDLFAKTVQLGGEDDRQHCRICMSYVEIYNERLHDLLQPFKPNARLDPQDMRKRKAGLEVKERHGQTCVPGALLVRVDTVQAALALVRKGNLSRAVRHTEMNQHSSRSHTILQVVVEQRLRGSMLRSKLNFVDLAGSERWSERVEMSEVRVNEMTSINQSLSTLITVVASLTEEGRSHIPYRDSKLTHLLQDSLGGNCNTTIIATISPSALAFEETCATLKFADRARNIVNRATVNLHTDYKLELELKTAEVKRLTGLLAKFASMVDSNGKIANSGGGSSGHANLSGGSHAAAAGVADKHRVRSVTDPETAVEAEQGGAAESAAGVSTQRDRPATVSSPSTTQIADHRVVGRAASHSPSPFANPLPRSSSDRALGGYYMDPSRQGSLLPTSASERGVGQSANPSRQNSNKVASANMAEVGRLRAELLLAKEDLLAERAARLRLESVVVASAALQQRYLPSESSVLSFHDGSSTPMTRGQSGSWGRSSINHSPEAPQAVRDADTAYEQQTGASQVTAGRSLLAGEASGASSISSPYAAKFAMSPLSSKPGSPTKRANAAGSQHPLRNSGQSLKDVGSLDAGSWIYIMGNRSSSLTAKQMARSTKAAASLA